MRSVSITSSVTRNRLEPLRGDFALLRDAFRRKGCCSAGFRCRCQLVHAFFSPIPFSAWTAPCAALVE